MPTYEPTIVEEKLSGPLPSLLHLRHTEYHDRDQDHNHNHNHTTQPTTTTTKQSPDKSPTQYSEHGHAITQIDPLTKHSGTSVNTFFNGLFTTIIAISTLGTSITFTFVLTPLSAISPSSPFSSATVTTFLAISWLLFLLCLATAALGSTLLTFFKKHWIRDWDGENGKTSQLTVQLYAVGTSAVMGAMIEGAFIFMCLSVVAYVPLVGWISLGFVGLVGLVIVVSVLNQVPWPWVRNTPKKDIESLK